MVIAMVNLGSPSFAPLLTYSLPIQILSITMSVFVINLFNYGLGKHLYDVPITDLYPYFAKVGTFFLQTTRRVD